MNNYKKSEKLSLANMLFFILSNFMIVLLLCIFVTYSWFSNGKGGAAVDPFTATIDNILDVDYTIYRNDGARYESGRGTYYSDSDTDPDTSTIFSMPEYDAIITEKNVSNNLIVKLTFAISSTDLSGKSLGVKVTTPNGSFNTAFTSTSGHYELSDAVDFNFFVYSESYNLDTSTSIKTYNNVTNYFKNNLDSNKDNFFTFSGTTPISKTGEKDISLDLSSIVTSSTSLTLYANITYNPTLVQELIGSSITSITQAGSLNINILSDISFELTLEEV